MKVQNEILYHITRNNKWKTGDTIISGDQENPLWTLCKSYPAQIIVGEQSVPIFEMFDRPHSFNVTQDTINSLYQLLKNISTGFAFYVREQIFEEVRKELYPQLPSRQKCLWLSDKNNLSFWKTMDINEHQYLLTLNLYGDIFCADAYWLKADTFSSIEYAERAKHYWLGELSNKPKIEYLFYGQAIIEDIVTLQ